MPKPEAKKPSLEAKIAQLNQDVEWFYDEDFQLDQALEKYRAATELAQEIERDLTELKNSVEVIGDFTKDV